VYFTPIAAYVVLNVSLALQLALFKNEVLVLRKTRHRNVLLFMGACTVLPNLAIVTQWAEGGSLHDKIHDAEISIPKPHKVDIACQVAQGMEYLHSKEITHRDLKSGNILIDNEIDYEHGSSPPQVCPISNLCFA
jgi:serine/threonine protein kinase